jgi:hypothetical protein
MFGLVDMEYIGGESGNPYFFFISYLVILWLGFIPKISFLACLEAPKKFVWVGGGGECVVVVESKLSDRLWLSFSLALAKPNNNSNLEK